MFIRNPSKLKWLTGKMESSKNTTQFTVEEKKEMFLHLRNAVGFEKFLHRKFAGQKSFSLEGAEILIPGLIALIEKGTELGIREFMIGMPHRGRLNVLANVLQKPYEQIFKEFEGEEFEEGIALGDVKYHLGYYNDILTLTGNKVWLYVAPNPSHLESEMPVVQGLSRAKIDQKYNGDCKKLLPVIIHGDAAIAGQGVVYEVIQMSDLQGYQDRRDNPSRCE